MRRIIEEVRGACESCAGQGVYYDPACRACGNRFGQAEIDAMYAKYKANTDWTDMALPCGHNWRKNYLEEHKCSTCEGEGRVERSRDLTVLVERLLRVCKTIPNDDLQAVLRELGGTI